MASRKTPPPQRGSFHPPSESVVYRDLLLFEERLKTNASILKRRKYRYQLFLIQHLLLTAFLALEVFLNTRFLDVPVNVVLKLIFPEDFGDGRTVDLHPYIAKTLLLVTITTLALFFLSGLYEEKIAYANRYVPHANRALRNFNMYLNVKHKPLRSRISFNPLSLLFHRNRVDDTSGQVANRPPAPDKSRKRGTSVLIPPIPPSSNPRGELIFSSRVDRNFRESYERYRAAFERKREAREQYIAAQTWWGWRLWPWNWGRERPTAPPRPLSVNRGNSPKATIPSLPSSPSRGLDSETESGSSRNSSRRSSPVPGSLGRPASRKGGSRSISPLRGVPRRVTPDRVRTESFSFLLTEEENFG